MRYGKNDALVQEVIAFIKNDLLFTNARTMDLNISVIDDFERAKELAWSQDLESVDVIWQNIKSNESSKVLNIISSDEDLKTLEDELYDVFSDEENYHEEFFPIDVWDINEEVQSDLYKCALNRLINGQQDHFYEHIFKIYQAGGWPCSWEGPYPQGQPIVYQPSGDFER
ncbi:cytoplasmic protein [Paenibacillus kandeliae]|uniref:cytoplasmic protein n=1 Tax=Paenibacillus kandeliae TaxID=3231269 RepID=UPI00345AE61D